MEGNEPVVIPNSEGHRTTLVWWCTSTVRTYVDER